MKKIFITLTLFLAAPVFAAVELDTDRNGATDISRGGTNSTTISGAKANLGIPSTLSALAGDTTHRVVTDAQIGIWDSKQPALTAGTDYLTPNGSAAGLVDFPASLATDSEVTTAVAGKANTSAFASPEAFQAAFGWIPSGAFDAAADQTITGDWVFSSGLEVLNISYNLGTLADLKIGNAQMVDDTKGNGDTNFLWSADKVFDQLATKQATLVSGTNIKTINGNSLVGSGDLTVSAGSGTSGYVALSAAPYSDVACTTGQYGYYGSTAYLCTGGFWTSKWSLTTHTNAAPTAWLETFEGAGSVKTWTTTAGAPDFDYTAAPLVGSQSLSLPYGAGILSADAGVNITEVSLVVKKSATDGADTTFFGFRAADGVTILASIAFVGSELKINCGTDIATSTGVNWDDNQQYIVWLRYSPGTGANATLAVRVAIDTGNDGVEARPTTAVATITSGTSTLAARMARVINFGANIGDILYDNITIVE